ncbi:MAG: 4Fe-4S binding protein [Candidatus Latescibacteria bacterium]|nr:4Fe-4S binding protein [Candidatus Latescibacterota bacterium]
MLRDIILIDEEKCDGCGLCVPNCVEGALRIVDGKAKLVSEIYCDGLGACLGACPQGALTIEKREADVFDGEAVEQRMAEMNVSPSPEPEPVFTGCPGSLAREMQPKAAPRSPATALEPQLGNWPVQLKLVAPGAPFLEGSDLLICADCVPFAVPDFHDRFLRGRSVLVGCPKLDDLQHYREKLMEIFRAAFPKSITVLRMEVPCCGGIAGAAVEARDRALPDMPVNVVVISIDGGVRQNAL